MRKIFSSPFFVKFLSPVTRAFVKQVPVIGTPLVELVSNLTKDKDAPNKHSYVSIAIQWGIACAILYDVIVNKGTNLNDAITLITQLTK